MQLSEVVAASRDVGATSARLAKRDRLAELLTAAGPAEIGVVVSWLSGELPQRQIGVGHAALRSPPPCATDATLSVTRVDETFTAIKATGGAGSQARRASLLDGLFGAATGEEQRFLSRLLRGDLGQGALAGVMTDALARTFDVPLADVRRAAMLGGALPAVASALARDGAAALAEFSLQVLRPVGPMLAQTAASVADALQRLGGRAVFEAKLDGARVQVHRLGAEVRVFTRTLDDVTARLPEVVAATLALPVSAFAADGEAIALRPDGRPQAFQDTASRFGRRVDLDAAVAAQPLSVFFFDVLHLDGADLMDRPYAERLAALERVVPADQRVARLVTADAGEAETFLARTLAAGHEGVMAKSLDAAYDAGRRGAGWLKIKPVHTFDLVVLAVEWGSGRRTGKLSNIHLGARDPATGGFVMLGKTFKGMTDEMLAWQTEHFLALADGPTDGYVVHVRPEQVVEVAIDGVQRSSRYPGGIALRFARVLRYRDDKPVSEIDTLDTVRALGGDGAT